MFDYLYGQVVSTSSGSVVLDINGFGLKLSVPIPLSQTLKQKTTAKFFTVLLLKNEEFKLYGFATVEERQMFEKLQTVSGIGPSIALNILSSISISTLYQAILQEDVKLFKSIKGVGQKTAQRIVLELKGSLQKEGLVLPTAPQKTSLQADAIAALVALGYSSEDACQAVTKAWEHADDTWTLDNLIREAFKKFQ